jgi:hypothetical protein
MLIKLLAGAGALLLTLVLLLAAAVGALANLAAGLSPAAEIGSALSQTNPSAQLDAAQFCALGAITPGKNTGYGTFTTDQIANATTIYQVSVQLGLPPYAAVVAIATALQESSLENLDYGDRDSLGLFQQRPSQGWGTPAEILDPVYASTKFYQALGKVPNWESIPLTQAAQAVQRSAYPTAYAKFSTTAQYLVATVSGALKNCP